MVKIGRTQAELDTPNTPVAGDPPQGVAHAALDPLKQLVVRYAAPMTLDIKFTDEVFNALRQHSDTTQIFELTSAIATYNRVARFWWRWGFRQSIDAQR